MAEHPEQTSLFGEALATEPRFKFDAGPVTRVIGEFWTAKQRQAASIHEVAYRACFKPQLPNFFISHLTNKGDIFYYPFSGIGTTVIEAALLGRNAVRNGINLFRHVG